MIAAIPFFALEVYKPEIFGTELPLDPWAILVCLGFVVGLEIARARAIRVGLDVRDIVDGAVFIVLSGFAVAHVVTALFYFPEKNGVFECLAGDLSGCSQAFWSVMRVWEGFSSTGGFIGAVLGAFVFYKFIRPRPALRHADIITYGFPFGWFFGRLGCASVHDHVGRPTTFMFGMDFDRGYDGFTWAAGDPYPWVSGVRHELGLYEAVYMVLMCGVFYVLGRSDRPPGFFLAMFAILYAPVRFGLDFLRHAETTIGNQDARYLGLTPAQYGMIAMFLAGLYMLSRLDHSRTRPLPTPQAPAQPPEPTEQGAA